MTVSPTHKPLTQRQLVLAASVMLRLADRPHRLPLDDARHTVLGLHQSDRTITTERVSGMSRAALRAIPHVGEVVASAITYAVDSLRSVLHALQQTTSNSSPEASPRNSTTSAFAVGRTLTSH
ncbi:hypothetical protein [Streptomyces sp. MN6]